MAEDGRIIIDTKINSEGIEKGEKELRSKLSKMAKDLDFKINIKSNSVDILKEKINGLNDVIIKNRNIISKGFGVSLDDFIAAKDKVKVAEEAINSYKTMLSNASNELNKLKIHQEATNKTLSNMQNFKDMTKRINMKSLENSFLKIKTITSNIASNFKNGMINSIDSIKGKLGGLTSSFMSIGGKFIRIFNYQVIRQIVRTVIKEFMQGLSDLEVYSNRFGSTMQNIKDSFKNLGDSIVTSVSPIIQAIAPTITWLIGLLTKLFNTISMFTTALFTGAKTATIADTSFSGYGKKVEKVGNATKKAKKDTKDMINSLAKFDKLDVFKQDKSNNPSGTIGASPADINKALNMFKEVAIPNNILDLKNKVLDIFQILLEKFKILSNEFNNGFNIGFKDNNIDIIKDKLISIKDIFVEIFSDKGVVEGFNNALKTITFNLGKVIGSISSVGVSLGKMLVGGFEKFLSQNKQRIKKSLKNIFDTTIDFSNLSGNFFVFLADIGKLFGEDKAQSIFGNFLSITYDLFDTTFNNIYKLAVKIADVIINPFISNVSGIKNALDGILSYYEGYTSGIKSVFNGISDSINSLVNDSIIPALDIVKQVWEDRIGVIVNSWNNSLKPIFEDIGKRVNPLGEKIGNAFKKLSVPINSIFKLIVDVYNKIRPFLQQYVYPMFEKMSIHVGSQIGNIFETVLDVVETFIDSITVSIENISNVFKSVIDILYGLIHGDWNKVWNSAKNVVLGLAKAVLSQLKVIPDLFVNAINSIIRIINNSINALNGIGFGDFRINIPKLPQVQKIPLYYGIPGLATGTVVSPGREFLARLGDNTREKEIVSPISTMKQAFSEALREYGGGNEAVLQLDGETFARLINPYSKAESNRLGMSMVSGV